MAAEEKKPSANAGGATAAPVAAVNAGNKPATAPAAVSAVVSVPKFGGNRGGKPRSDGLAPGSPEAIKADRDKDAKRKREEREARQRLAQPPPLPSAAPAPGNSTVTPGGTEVPNAADAGLQAPAPVQWDPEMIRKFTDVVVDAAEAKRVSNLSGAAREGGLPENIVKRIEKDSHYPVPAKASLQIALPRLTAKYLNKAGISAEYADEAALLTSVGAILVQGRKLQASLDELIEQTRKLQNERTNRTNQNSQAPPSPGNSTL